MKTACPGGGGSYVTRPIAGEGAASVICDIAWQEELMAHSQGMLPTFRGG